MAESINKSIVLLAIILVLAAPFQSLAQRGADDNRGSLQDAKRLAEMDAENDVNAMKWIGCGLTVIGVGIAYLVLPSPPLERLMGKSADYVWMYTTAYKAKARSRQLHYSLVGLTITSTIALIVGCVFAVQACEESRQESCASFGISSYDDQDW